MRQNDGPRGRRNNHGDEGRRGGEQAGRRGRSENRNGQSENRNSRVSGRDRKSGTRGSQAGKRSFDNKHAKRFPSRRPVGSLSDVEIAQAEYRQEALIEGEELREDRLEGRNPVREALRAGRTIEKAWVQKPVNGSYDRVLYELMKDIREQGGLINEVDAEAMERISQTFSHQGIIVQTAVHGYVELDELIAMAKADERPPFFLILDKIQEAYNLGSILRVADACGAHGVIFPKRRSVGLNAVTAKASAGAIEHVPCCRVNNLTQTLQKLKEEGIWIAGTDAEGSSLYTDTDLTGPMALVIGSEGKGISPALAKHCDYLVSIPMFGQVNSLNAAVAAGVVAFEIVRQRQAEGANDC